MGRMGRRCTKWWSSVASGDCERDQNLILLKCFELRRKSPEKKMERPISVGMTKWRPFTSADGLLAI